MKTATTTTKVALTVVRVTGAVQIVTGLLFWTGNALALLPVHLLSGVVLVLALWVLAVLAARAGVGAGRAALAGLWGALVVGLGLTQSQLLPGDAHWVVQVVHLLVGLGAMGLAQNLATRTRRGRGGTRSRVAPASRVPGARPGPGCARPPAASRPTLAALPSPRGRAARQGPPPSGPSPGARSGPRRLLLAVQQHLLGESEVPAGPDRHEVAVLGPPPGPGAPAASLAAQPIGRAGDAATGPLHLPVAAGRPDVVRGREHPARAQQARAVPARQAVGGHRQQGRRGASRAAPPPGRPASGRARRW